MKNENFEKIQRPFEMMAYKRWFLIIFIILNILPPIVTKGYNSSNPPEIIGYILSHALFTSSKLSSLYPIFKIVPIFLVFGLIFLGNRINRIFSLYAGINFLLFVFLQYISISDEYGFAIFTGNFILTLVVAYFWLMEAFTNRNDFSPRKIPIKRFWVVPLVFISIYAFTLSMRKTQLKYITHGD
jgi:hypothetical protein